MSQYRVYFDTYDSIDDFGLILTDVKIPTPESKRSVVDVPGRDGQLDLSISPMRFKNRTIVLSFVMKSSVANWQDIKSDLMNLIHGQYMDVVLEVDPTWYWHGYVTVNEASINIHKGTIQINIDADPYKYRDHSVEVTSPDSIICLSSKKPVSPTVTTDASITVTDGTTTVSLDSGTHAVTDIIFEYGPNTLTFTGSANVTVTWTEGSL